MFTFNYSAKNRKRTIYTPLILYLCFTSYSLCWSSDVNTDYYLRSDVKTENGIIIEANLLMVPADTDFRKKKYIRFVASGKADINARPDPVSAAKHDALNKLVIANGVKSIKSASTSVNSIQHEESILSYEGFIKSPYAVSHQGYTDNGSKYALEIEVWFSPVAYPSEWSFYYFKKKLSDITRNVISVFK